MIIVNIYHIICRFYCIPLHDILLVAKKNDIYHNQRYVDIARVSFKKRAIFIARIYVYW